MAGKSLGVVEVKGFPGFGRSEQARVTQFFSGSLRTDLKDAKRFAAIQRLRGRRVSVKKVVTGAGKSPLGYAVAVEL
ncbi:hypothetical protein LCGC14_0585110 [marine sediment metagenome]|uniref:Uncharacterized protein n=1 Tax=marine sediment metagenome TaxID=412755 RepID=A0A0F9RK61_9ZZZZ